MKRLHRNIVGLFGAAFAVAVLAATGAAKPPPPAPVTLPGGPHNRVTTRWLAPYVLLTQARIDRHWLTSVRWLTPDGKVRRELSGPHLGVQPGHVYDYSKGHWVIHGVHGDWKFALPEKSKGPYLTSSPDGRVFVHQYHPAEGQIAVDLYAGGKLAGTVGPFWQYLGRSVQVADDGSVALIVWKDKAKEVPQVVAAGPDGKVRVQADCDGPVDAPKAAPGAAGVLVQPNTGAPGRNTWIYYPAEGKASSLHLGPNADLVCWLPETETALCATAVGSTYRFHLIDWATGKRLWEIEDPNGARAGSSAPQVATAGGLLLFAGLQAMDLGGKREPVRSLQAVEARTGQLVARWWPTPLRRFDDGGRFVRQGERLYLVTDDEFAQINVRDVAAQKNGWR